MSAAPFPYSREQEAWLRDLETTEAPQTRGALHRLTADNDGPAGYCCLGRAAVVLGVPEVVDGTLGYFHGKDGTLSDELTATLRLRSGSGSLLKPFAGDPQVSSLTELNDDYGMSFKAIAAYIRANPWNVFLTDEPEESEKEVA